jgi:hypothetical protein
MARFGGVLRPVPESTCASLRACLWLGSASAMPCPAQRSSALLLAPGQSQHLLPLSPFSLFLPLRQPHPHGIPPWVSQSSSPRIARRKRKKRKDKGRHHPHPTAVPTTSKTFVSWRASATHAVRVASQTNAPPHTLLPLRATNGSRHVLPHPPDPPSHVRLQPRATLRPSTPNTASEHVSTRRRPPPSAPLTCGAGQRGLQRQREGEKREKSFTYSTVRYPGRGPFVILPACRKSRAVGPASPSPDTERWGPGPAPLPFSPEAGILPVLRPLVRPSVRPSARCYKYTARHPPRSRSLPSPAPPPLVTHIRAILCSLLCFPANPRTRSGCVCVSPPAPKLPSPLPSPSRRSPPLACRVGLGVGAPGPDRTRPRGTTPPPSIQLFPLWFSRDDRRRGPCTCASTLYSSPPPPPPCRRDSWRYRRRFDALCF